MERRAERDALVFHLWWGGLALLVLLLPADVEVAWRIAAVVGGYVVAVPLLARRRRQWWPLWLFVCAVAAGQLLPDWVLAEHIGSLRFPTGPVPTVGPVPVSVWAAWTIPLFGLLLLGRAVEARQGRGLAYTTLVLGALVLFAATERWAAAVGWWQPVGVRTWAGVPAYILPAEVLLVCAAYYAEAHTRGRWLTTRLVAAGVVVLLYTGAAVCGWFVVEDLLG